MTWKQTTNTQICSVYSKHWTCVYRLHPSPYYEPANFNSLLFFLFSFFFWQIVHTYCRIIIITNWRRYQWYRCKFLIHSLSHILFHYHICRITLKRKKMKRMQKITPLLTCQWYRISIQRSVCKWHSDYLLPKFAIPKLPISHCQILLWEINSDNVICGNVGYFFEIFFLSIIVFITFCWK